MHRSRISSRTRTRGRGRLSSPLGVGALLQAFEKFAESAVSNQAEIIAHLDRSSTAQQGIERRLQVLEARVRDQSPVTSPSVQRKQVEASMMAEGNGN